MTKHKTKPILVYFSEHEREQLRARLGEARLSPWLRELALRTAGAEPEVARLDPAAVVRPLFACAVCMTETGKTQRLDPWGLVCASCAETLRP